MRYVPSQIAAILLLAATGYAAVEPQRGRLVAEGHLVAGAEGRVVYDPNESRWSFYPTASITDGKGLLPAGQGVVLLAGSVMEQMGQLAGDEKRMDVRLWAMVTEYRGRNSLYSLYFLPMRDTVEAPAAPAEPKTAESGQRQRESVLPTEILQMIERNQAPDLRRLDELVVVTTDRNLIHRTGIISPLEDGYVFVPDAFGHNVSGRSYHLLSCRTLEATQRAMQRGAGRQRYVVSGVLTEFEGRTYLLLRRAVRSYTHGNFTP